MHLIKGDLIHFALAGEFDVIIHGCNCQCQMGKGIALAVKKMLPEAYRVDCLTPKGDPSKLGTFSHAEIQRGAIRFVVINAYTQLHWRGTGVKADYDAIRKVFAGVRQQFGGKRIGYPKIGAGLAGGDWSLISGIISEELAGESHTYVEFG